MVVVLLDIHAGKYSETQDILTLACLYIYSLMIFVLNHASE
jgi:hypothetical protein